MRLLRILALAISVPLCPQTNSAGQPRSGSPAQIAKTSPAEVAFAYANSSGTELLTLGDRQLSARSFDRAVCPNSRILEIKFLSAQKAGPHSTGRNTSNNFDQDAGDLFAIVDGKVTGDESCLLANHEYLRSKEILPATARSQVCEAGLRFRIPTLENRPLASCFLLAGFAGGAHFLAVQYQPKGKDLLAAFVLLTPSGAFSEALPATLKDNSAWRVDDEGQFNASDIITMFALAGGDGSIEVAIVWPGAEGDDLTLYRTSAQGRLQKIVQAYRYRSPS